MSINENIPKQMSNPHSSFDLNTDVSSGSLDDSLFSEFGEFANLGFEMEIGERIESVSEKFGEVAPLVEDIISKITSATESIAGEGKVVVGCKEDILDSSKPNQVMSLQQLCKTKKWGAKELVENHEKGNIVIGHLGGDKLHIQDDCQENFMENGFEEINDEGIAVHHHRDNIEVVAWTPEEMARINRVAGQAFTALAQAYAAHNEKAESDDDNRLKDKTFTQITGQKPLVRQDQFPDLKRVKQEQDKIAYMESNRASEDFAAESQKEFDRKTKELDAKADERREYYEVRDQDRETIKQDVHNFELKQDKAA